MRWGSDLRALLPDATSVLDPAGKPLVSGKPTPGYIGFCVAGSGVQSGMIMRSQPRVSRPP
jgi:hypothetical protein